VRNEPDPAASASPAIGRPGPTEAVAYYFRYIDRIETDDILGAIEAQQEEASILTSGISEERSLHRYAPGKWSIRQVLNHVTDCERVFLFRAFWFARNIGPTLPGFDQDPVAEVARADDLPWSSHVQDFRAARRASLAFLRTLPPDAWTRSGIASGNPFSVRALAYVLAGHFDHHAAILREQYL
jgi:hypothetical protein